MDTEELINRYLPLVKRHWLPLVLGFAGLILLGYGLIGLFVVNKTGSEDIVFEANSGCNSYKKSGKIGEEMNS